MGVRENALNEQCSPFVINKERAMTDQSLSTDTPSPSLEPSPGGCRKSSRWWIGGIVLIVLAGLSCGAALLFVFSYKMPVDKLAAILATRP